MVTLIHTNAHTCTYLNYIPSPTAFYSVSQQALGLQKVGFSWVFCLKLVLGQFISQFYWFRSGAPAETPPGAKPAPKGRPKGAGKSGPSISPSSVAVAIILGAHIIKT